MDRLQLMTSAVGLYLYGEIEYDDYCKRLQRVIGVRQMTVVGAVRSSEPAVPLQSSAAEEAK